MIPMALQLYSVRQDCADDLFGVLRQVADMGYAGVDIIRDHHGRYSVLEVNSIPAWKGLQSVSKVSIADLLVDDFLSLCVPRSDEGGIVKAPLPLEEGVG